ncbi:uncharacterized protein LOC119676638 [Teleopsis dalmanni]|uniref:uncharacterized protein LOC119676638 n=1 Tax=Teleopsis dalmanni TaxID=139649 RepID=UPI0018CCFFAE|nr:uncharacterized protein LOC119676638 [Teleopsis dalmanni]
MNKQQLQRLKKRTSFTPSQTLAAIKRQQLRKQQQKQHNKLNNNQMIVDVSNYNIAVVAPSSSAASSASVAGAGAAAASIVASSSSSVEATLSASTTMSYINNKTDGSSTKARVDNKRRVKRATDEAQKTTYNNTKKSVRISTATATTSTTIRAEKKNKLKHTTKKQKSNLSLSSDRKWQKNKNMATAENILIGNGEKKYHNNRRKNTHKREVSPTRVIHHYERETETEVDAARIAKRETATAAVVVKHTNATKRTSKHLANAKTSIIAAQYESQQQQHQQHQQHQQYSKPGQHEETLQQQLTTQREFNDFSNKNKNKNKNKDNELRKQRNADNAKKDNLEKIRIRKSLTMQNNMERHTIASKNKNGSNSNNNNVASNIKIPNAPLISNNNNNSNMKGQESQQEHKQRNTKSNELNVANINSAIVNNMQQTINDLNQIEDIVASNIVDSESVNDIFDSNFTNNDEDIDADIDVDADADAEADAEAEAVAETETDMEVENEVEADLDADTETDDDDDDDNGMEDEEIEDDVALLNALDDAATMQSHQVQHQQQQQLLLQQQQQEQYVQEPHFDYSRMEYSFSNGVATHSLIGGNSVDMGEGGSINMENNDNIVYSTMELECMPGYDGGLQQQFFLEAYDSKTKKLRLNTTSTYSDVPIFRIDLSDLTSMDYYPDPNPALHLVVYSVNQKGRSEPIVLENIPINEAEKRTDGRIGLSILPLAALLTGTLFTVGIAVLFVVVVAVRKRRCQGGRSMCDDKDKHLGMDVTVTAPLETGAGHQRLVVAYTLKQGIEKQPDILSAQKSATGSATSSPMGSRPSGLYCAASSAPAVGNNIGIGGNKLNFSGASTSDYDSSTINYNVSPSNDPLQQQLNSPPSQSSTLKLTNDSRKNFQNLPLLYDALPMNRHDPLNSNMNYAGSNSTLSSGGSAGNASLTNHAASSLLQNSLVNGHYTNHHTLPHPATTLQHAHATLQHLPPSTAANEQLSIADYLAASSLIDYNLSKSTTGMLPGNCIGGGMTLPKSLGMGSILGINSNNANNIGGTLGTSAGQQHATNLSSGSAATITQKTNASRNHIITDTLPGPESCV